MDAGLFYVSFCFSIAEIKAGTFIENIFDVGNEYYTKHKTYLFNITVIYGYGWVGNVCLTKSKRFILKLPYYIRTSIVEANIWKSLALMIIIISSF